MNRYGLRQEEIDAVEGYGVSQAQLAADLAALDAAERRHVAEPAQHRGRQAAMRQDESELATEVRAYAVEHKCALGVAYEAIGAKRARAEWEAAREQD